MLDSVKCCAWCCGGPDWVELGIKGRLGINLLDRNGTEVKMKED